jgi:hypothetical protein
MKLTLTLTPEDLRLAVHEFLERKGIVTQSIDDITLDVDDRGALAGATVQVERFDLPTAPPRPAQSQASRAPKLDVPTELEPTEDEMGALLAESEGLLKGLSSEKAALEPIIHSRGRE